MMGPRQADVYDVWTACGGSVGNVAGPGGLGGLRPEHTTGKEPPLGGAPHRDRAAGSMARRGASGSGALACSGRKAARASRREDPHQRTIRQSPPGSVPARSAMTAARVATGNAALRRGPAARMA